MNFHLQGSRHHRTVTGRADDFRDLACALRQAAAAAAKSGRTDFQVPKLRIGGDLIDSASFRLTPDIAPVMNRHRLMMRLRPFWVTLFLIVTAIGLRDWFLTL